MVCPVTRPMYFDLDGAIDSKDNSISVYLPEGTGWYDFYTKKYYEGGQDISVNAPIDRIPVFVKEGSIIPMTEFKPYVTAHDEIYASVYPGKDAEFNLYEDAGDGYGYENGEYSFTTLKWSDEDKTLTSSDGREIKVI